MQLKRAQTLEEQQKILETTEVRTLQTTVTMTRIDRVRCQKTRFHSTGRKETGMEASYIDGWLHYLCVAMEFFEGELVMG